MAKQGRQAENESLCISQENAQKLERRVAGVLSFCAESLKEGRQVENET